MAIKVIEDTIKDADQLLVDMNSLLGALKATSEALRPFDEDARKEFKSVPMFLAQTSATLRKVPISKFEFNYPALSSFVANGESSNDSFRRLHDALYSLSQLNEKLTERKYLLKFDTEREEARALANRALGDLAISIISQFELMDSDAYVYLSVDKYCDANGISPSVLLGTILQALEVSGESPRGYEKLSAYYDRMMEFDPTFVGECEEYAFPLNDEMCEALLSGKLSLPDARKRLADHLAQREEKELSGVNSMNLIQAMHLQ